MTPAARLVAATVTLGVLLGGAATAALFVGTADLSPRAVVAVLAGGGGDVERTVVLALRLPRIAAGALAGGALAVAGAALQALTRNPLAEPSVLGVASGAAFGVVAGQLLGLGSSLLQSLGLAACAFAGALVAGAAVWAIARRAGGLPVHTLLLAGVIVGIFFVSAISLLISLVDVGRLGGMVHWLLGNVVSLPPAPLAVFAGLVVAGTGLCVSQARRLNLLALGDEAAVQLGVDAEALKRRIFAGAALLTACVVAFAGPIGFVGLIVPHALRMLVGADNRVLLPAAGLGGAVFLLSADTLARSVLAPAELAVGVITSFCGAPFFVYLLRARAGAGKP